MGQSLATLNFAETYSKSHGQFSTGLNGGTRWMRESGTLKIRRKVSRPISPYLLGVTNKRHLHTGFELSGTNTMRKYGFESKQIFVKIDLREKNWGKTAKTSARYY
jgi:hypothetical protein